MPPLAHPRVPASRQRHGPRQAVLFLGRDGPGIEANEGTIDLHLRKNLFNRFSTA